MTITDEQLAERVKVIAAFCLNRRGRCFPGWSNALIFQYLCWHALNGSLFLAIRRDKLVGAGIAWTMDAADIQRRDMERKPLFDWQQVTGDSIIIAEAFGDDETSACLWARVMSKYPDHRRVFTYRTKPFSNQIRLREYDAKHVSRFLSKSWEAT